MSADVDAVAGYGVELDDELLIKIFQKDIKEFIKETGVNECDALENLKCEGFDIAGGLGEILSNYNDIDFIKYGLNYEEDGVYYAIVVSDPINRLIEGLTQFKEIGIDIKKENLIFICETYWW